MPSSQISKKKLKAIVFTDIADFTSLSAKDEQKAVELIQKQNDIIKPIVDRYNGEWLKEMGDGLLLSFDSSLEAVRCSIEIQETLKKIDELDIRIGIHQGDIFILDGDVFGDDVNIASRVEGFAPIGGISLSDKVHKDILGVSDIKTSFIGHRKLIGVQQETKIRCITSHNLPQFNLSKLPIIAYYVCFFWAALSFVACTIHPIAKYSINSTVPISQIIRMSIIYFMLGITYLLIGYSTLSFSRGISSKSQRFLVYLSYIFVLLPFILFIFNPGKQAVYLQIITSPLPIVFVFLLIIIVIPSIITIFLNRYLAKRNN